jgi:hypothetical protein
VLSDEAAQKVRKVLGSKLDDYLAGKPLPGNLKTLVERMLAKYGG